MEGGAGPVGYYRTRGGEGTGAVCLLCSSLDEYQVARATLTKSFQGKFDKFVIPCVVASGDIQDRKGTEPLSFRCSALAGAGGAGSVCQKVTVPLLLPIQIQVPRVRAKW